MLRTCGDPEQAIGEAVRLGVQERARRREQPRRKLRGPEATAAARSQREIRQAQLERNPAGRQRLPAQAGGDPVALHKQYPRQFRLVADVAIERRLGGNALRVTLGMDRAIIAPLSTHTPSRRMSL